MDAWSPTDLLPGSLFVLLAGLTLLLLSRRFDPIPRAFAGLAVALPIVLFGSSLFGGRVLLPLDFLIGFEPFRQLAPPASPGHPLQGDLPLLIHPSRVEVGAQLAAGRWPLWNDHVGTGMGLMADPQAQAFQPLVLAASPLAAHQGPALTAALKVFFALVFLFLLLRRQGLGATAATAGALAYGLGSFVVLWVGWPLSTTAAALPAVLYGLVGCRQQRGRRFPILLTLALVTTILAGHPQTIAFALAFAALFAASLARERRRIALSWLACGLVAAGLTAPVWLPASRLLNLSDRRLVMTGPPPERGFEAAALAAALAPPALGDHRLGAHWGPINRLEDSAAFVSTAAWLLALSGALWAGLSAAGAGRRLPQAGVVGLAGATGLALPTLPTAWIADLPVVGLLFAAGPQRLGFLAAFALAYLAAGALDRWQRGELRRGPLLLAAGLLTGGLLWAYLGHRPPQDGTLETFRHGWLATQLVLLWAVTALLMRAPRNRRVAVLLPALIAGLIAAELLAGHGSANPSQPTRLAFPRTPAIEALTATADQGSRFVALGNALAPNLGTLYGLRDLRINNPAGPAVMRRATAPLRPPEPGQRWHLAQPEHPLYDLLAVGRVLAPPGRPLPPPLRPILRHPAGWVWERPGALPRLFLPASAERFTGGRWEEWLADNPDFAQRALVQAIPEGRQQWRQGAAGEIASESSDGTRWSARVSSPEPRLLASSLYQDGGWRALVNGERRPIVLTNGPFVGLWLAAGESRVELLYRPLTHLRGCLLAALALSLGFAFAARPTGRPGRASPRR